MSTALATAEAAQTPKRRGIGKFYVAGLVLVALALFGAWMWVRWRHWWFGAEEARRRQQAAADELGVPVEKTVDLPPSPSGSGAARGEGVKLDLVLIPAGMFDMGSPDDEDGRSSEEGPRHRVRISRPFYIGKHEVTQEQWKHVMGSNPSEFKGQTLPVEQVTWEDSQAFLKTLSALVKNAGEFRLPTEAEWEWACRAGARARFCSGDADSQFAEHAWYEANSAGTTHAVGGKLPNAWGLYDCHGNVYEWCSDRFGGYSADPWPGVFRCQTDPHGPASGSIRVLRGGSYMHPPGNCRSASRIDRGPSDRVNDLGFRVAATVPEPRSR